MTKRINTHDKFINKVYELVGDEYIVLSDYIKSKEKLLIKHNKYGCGHEYRVAPYAFLRGNRCPVCSEIKRIENTKKACSKTHEQFVNEIFNLVGNEYNILSMYINAKTKILMRHNKCKHEWHVDPYSFLSGGKRCPKCQHRSYKKTTEEFKKEIQELVGNEYEVLSEYVTNLYKISMIHNKCGNNYEVAPALFLHGNRCPICSKIATGDKLRKTHDLFLEEVKNLVNDEYSVLSQYTGAHDKIWMKHNICNNSYPVEPNSFLKGNRCPYCRESKGEKYISNILLQHKINSIRQYMFNDCRNILPLPFDFAILNKNKLLCLIEYDGEHHFRPVCFGGMSLEKAKEHFFKMLHNDNIKNNYCKDNNIPLLRIPYWEFDNIEQILINWLSDFL